MPAKNWKVYILTCADETFYTGITNDLTARIDAHNQGTGARYTRGRQPVNLAGYWEYANRSEASKAEYRIKGLTRRQKQDLLKTAKRSPEK